MCFVVTFWLFEDGHGGSMVDEGRNSLHVVSAVFTVFVSFDKAMEHDVATCVADCRVNA